MFLVSLHFLSPEYRCLLESRNAKKQQRACVLAVITECCVSLLRACHLLVFLDEPAFLNRNLVFCGQIFWRKMNYGKKSPSMGTPSVYSHVTTRSSANLRSSRSVRSVKIPWYQKPLLSNAFVLDIQRGAVVTAVFSLVRLFRY